eukprot:346322-Rhodomonas_salina.1
MSDARRRGPPTLSGRLSHNCKCVPRLAGGVEDSTDGAELPRSFVALNTHLPLLHSRHHVCGERESERKRKRERKRQTLQQRERESEREKAGNCNPLTQNGGRSRGGSRVTGRRGNAMWRSTPFWPLYDGLFAHCDSQRSSRGQEGRMEWRSRPVTLFRFVTEDKSKTNPTNVPYMLRHIRQTPRRASSEVTPCTCPSRTPQAL